MIKNWVSLEKIPSFGAFFQGNPILHHLVSHLSGDLVELMFLGKPLIIPPTGLTNPEKTFTGNI